ncbi:3-succinoylsemialdehyde-pyridine dehydrogenase [Cupriavidus yeoncheonensis]|uniref:3-succinoylsemialdehyde-pyridine dehydrogenase n=1 Tax=Cupriavidus yeoncheonensis TaxID=1462994 RepID=A0A916MX38_9BURK|nr:aldehyde dehydrogenase family protein [Cupriavidus yeoncheonensis]CAG2137184.1 3-succinoylsemialdehyde-pyridine dehydrogenase [Cupriavidus yeoncheonensis]
MKRIDTFYIHGEWIPPAAGATTMDIVNPATEEVIGKLSLGTAADADRAVAAARAAFPSWSQSSREDRIALLGRIMALYKERLGELAEAVRTEMGAPVGVCNAVQAPVGLAAMNATLEALRTFEFETEHGRNFVRREPIGVAALVTAWNWPLMLIATKVSAAIAAGCTIVLKPSEIAPLDAHLFAQIMHDAGTPAGVFNMIYGEGKSVGARLSSHPEVDVISITGSTRAGVEVAISAAPTVKRVHQELGGKSPLLILDDADIADAVQGGVASIMMNSGQTCIAPTRMLVPRTRYDEAVAVAAATANALRVGDPADPATKLGPISNRAQYEKVQHMIGVGIEEGARVIAGGPGRPEGLDKGFYARPTVLADVNNAMTIAREEIFGPVLVIIPYDAEDDGIEIANDTNYGLAAYIASADRARALRVAARLRAGSVRINGAPVDFSLPFGGYKSSGNGRENGAHGLTEYLEVKSVSM